MNEFEKTIKKINQTTNLNCDYGELNNFLKYTQNGSLITIGARPAMGKTGFLIGLINSFMTQEKNICFYSIENCKEKIIKKIFARNPRIDLFKDIDDELKDLMLENAKLYDDKKMNIIDKTSLAIEEIEEDVKNNDYEIVLIDNIQILKTKNQAVLNKLDYIAKELKRIAQENNLIVFLTSQISRQVEKRVNKVPKLIDIKNTSCLEDVSDVVIMLYRENYYDLKCNNNNAQVCIIKNNFGDIGYFELEFKYGFFYEKRNCDSIWLKDKIMKTNSYIVDELRNKIKSNDEINKQYFKKEIKSFAEYTKDNYKTLYNNKIEEITAFNKQSEDLKGEDWKEYSKIPKLKISNLGRIQYDDVILNQVEEFKNDESKTHIGYLQLDKEQATELEIWSKIKENYIYQLVANIWLDEPDDFENEIYEVHHIDNDGYNNTVDNLIWVKKCQHGHIHSKNISECIKEKCGNCICNQVILEENDKKRKVK